MEKNLLVEQARKAAERAYAPYSGIHVGAALETDTGEVFTGCNVENASYSLTICAERNAVFAAVAAGHTRFRRLAVWADGKTLFSPCGACRQVLAEFAADMQVVIASPTEQIETTLAELLPLRFEM
ncbi:MAG: cytidine deaminase [Candidatus Cloacimonetes bacterium]|nr:cytidine deaminase [Candidatus Cloacimonadota bacterium]